MPKPAPISAFRLIRLGLVVIEHAAEDENCCVYRPVGLAGTTFPDWEDGVNYGQNSTTLRVSAPPAGLYSIQTAAGKRWVVDISVAAAPGPGPVYFHEEFSSVEDAVTAISECYFGNRVDFNNESLGPWRKKA
jgi:hypothetical protein